MALAVAAFAFVPLAARAENTANPCGAGTVISGSGDVVVEGKQAARAGDTAGCSGSTNLFIDGKPTAVQGDQTGCGGSIVSGASGVFIATRRAAAASRSPGLPRLPPACRGPGHSSVALNRGCS